MDTIRERNIKEVITRGAVVRLTSPSTGYYSNCGAKVIRARRDISPSEMPCMVIWPQEEEGKNQYSKSRKEMRLQVEGCVHFGSTDASVAGEIVLGDLIKCFTTQSWVRDKIEGEEYIESIIYVGGEVLIPQSGDKAVVAIAKFLLTYSTEIGDPYTK